MGGEANYHLRIAWIVICIVISAAAILYLSVGHNASHGDMLVMPLDDVYIHFQYARMFAAGQPFRYNPGDPPTSGATSLLYPILLALGYVTGFQGDRLALWAIGIGILTWLGSAWLMFRLMIAFGIPPLHEVGQGVRARGEFKRSFTFWIALLMAVAFALSGGISWAFVSGMETGLMIFATLLTLWYMTRHDLRGTILAAIFVSVIRPEGLVIAVGAILLFAFRTPRRRWPILLLPLLAGLIQPLINLILTGSATASGMQAKSFLYNVPFDWSVLLNNILSTIIRVWREQFTGIDIDGVIYSTGFLLLIALLFAIYKLFRRTDSPSPNSERGLGGEVNIVFLWLFGLTASVSILETAFWQFKRYQQPIYALLFVLTGWGLTTLLQRLPQLTIIPLLIAAAFLVFSLTTFIPFVTYYGDNINEVASMQIPMARYVASITAPGTRIGVHDIGVMRYIGDRPTYDAVGLTTPGAARAWRNGPGAVYEMMLTSPYRPDYLAIYTEPHGLSYFKNTDLFRDVLKRFPSTNPPHNVASASNEQIVTHIELSDYWAKNGGEIVPGGFVEGFFLVDTLNVADLADEDAHQYRWWQSFQRNGFATEVYQFKYALYYPNELSSYDVILDGGRLLTGSEEMTITTHPGQDLEWVTRLHPRDEAKLTLSVDGQTVETRIQPNGLGGQWLDVGTIIPGRYITKDKTRLRIDVNSTDGFYMPYYHRFYQNEDQPYNPVTYGILLPQVNIHFGDGIILLGKEIGIDSQTHRLRVDVEWRGEPGKPRGDAKVFVHLYGNTAEPPIAQYDNRPMGGIYPPANWLPGVFTDTYYLPLPQTPGIYTIAIGMYDPTTNQRLTITGEGADSDTISDNRLFIGTIMVGL